LGGHLSYCEEGFFPGNVLDALDVGVCEEGVGVTSRLGYSFAETHAKESDLGGSRERTDILGATLRDGRW
jgi:hypothetical protein